MTALANTTTGAPDQGRPRRTGEQVELARYTVPGAGERALVGQRVRGSVIVVDAPTGDEGRVYLIERGLEQDGNDALIALVRDYVDQAGRLQAVPAIHSVLKRELTEMS